MQRPWRACFFLLNGQGGLYQLCWVPCLSKTNRERRRRPCHDPDWPLWLSRSPWISVRANWHRTKESRSHLDEQRNRGALHRRYICVIATDINGRSSCHRPSPAYDEKSDNEFSLSSNLADVSVEDQLMADVSVKDQPVALVEAKAALICARNALTAPMKVINGALECMEEKLGFL